MPSEPNDDHEDLAQPQTLDQRLADLDALAERPLAEHAEVYQGLHRELQAELARIDSA